MAALRCRASFTARKFHTSSVCLARGENRQSARANDVPFDLTDLEPAEDDDTTVGGHLMLRQQRQLLYHLRLIEHEMPKLVGTLSLPACSTIAWPF
jgi:small subunit ribosomal protein S35